MSIVPTSYPPPVSTAQAVSDSSQLGLILFAWLLLILVSAALLWFWVRAWQQKKRLSQGSGLGQVQTWSFPDVGTAGAQIRSAPASATTSNANQPDEVGQPAQIHIALDLPPGARLRVTVESLPPLSEAPRAAETEAGDWAEAGQVLTSQVFASPAAAPPASTGQALPAAPVPLQQGLGTQTLDWLSQVKTGTQSLARRWPLSFEATLFALALLVYLLTRLIRLSDFPIYFFADEAAQTLYAEELIQQKFRDPQGFLFPIYVEAAGLRWTPLLPMYIHAVTLTLLGKSIFVTRLTSVLIGFLGAVSAGWMLKKVLHVRYWWAGALLLALAPAWLLHSRTAFETVMTSAFYSCFLLFYLLYRTQSPKYLYLALVFGALTFYTYSNAQVIMAASALLLFISDLPYHLKQWRTLIIGLLLAVVLAYPFLAFRSHHPEALGEHLRVVNSYWFQPISLFEKTGIFISKLTYGLSPVYWFLPNQTDLPRHRMDSLGNLLLITLPLLIVGILVCIWRIRSAPHRALLLATIATPAGGALLDIGITRVLAFVIPASILMTIGLDSLVQFTSRLLARAQKKLPERAVAVGMLVILAIGSFALLNVALTQGPYWFNDYGLYGMQYGAKQLFQEVIPPLLERDPNAILLVSSTWANGTDRFLQFFFTPEERGRLRMDGIETYLFRRTPLRGNEIFLMTPAEYEKAVSSQKFTNIQIEETVPYPDGSIGFLFVRLEYVENVDAVFAAEKEARQRLLEGQVMIDGQPVKIRYSQIDMGAPELIFDGDDHTLMRGLEANPFIVELYFSEPQSISRLDANFGLVQMKLTARLYADPADEPVVYEFERINDNNDPRVSWAFDRGPAHISNLRFEFFNPLSGETANFHIFELKFTP